ncbi:hypothetical protein [Moraxella sp. ZY210820]|uniref:hypothetical protein n=1 Tax=unclassified Moraxella TaxID=2685852 RepID=UPI00272F5F7D|nr:hypothetical protein [Moraxella sp. ZY210820]WLF83251.1 hypothetical protein LU301_08245 [Moraxella sp. ZY210820]
MKPRNKRQPLTPEQRAEQLELFDSWLWDMPNALERFKNRMPKEIQDQLDFSIQSLDIVEKHLLDNYETIEQIKNEPSYILDGYAVYVGETFRHSLRDRQPNQWELMLEEDNVFYLLPVIKVRYYTACPLTLCTACIDRRWGNYWSWILQNQLDES